MLYIPLLIALGYFAYPSIHVLKQNSIVSIKPTSTLIEIPTQTPYPSNNHHIEYYQPHNTIAYPTLIPTPILQPTEKTVDCYYKNDSGIILYDFGKVNSQKCDDLSKEYFNNKNTEIKNITSAMCMDRANFDATMCKQDCLSSDNSCWSNCDKLFQQSLSKCTQ